MHWPSVMYDDQWKLSRAYPKLKATLDWLQFIGVPSVHSACVAAH